MREDAPTDLTDILGQTGRGDLEAAETLVEILYDDLRMRARSYLRGERIDHSLQPTALVHEAYLRLAGRSSTDWKGKTHFFAAAAIAMRRILIDHARSRKRDKRGGGVEMIELDDNVSPVDGRDIEILALQEALEHLFSLNERHARVVELRFFSGMTNEEVASILGVSRATVELDWRFARAWLRSELRGGAASEQVEGEDRR